VKGNTKQNTKNDKANETPFAAGARGRESALRRSKLSAGRLSICRVHIVLLSPRRIRRAES
jgi:hypothetical protein